MKFRLPQTIALELPGYVIDAKIIYTAITNQTLVKKNSYYLAYVPFMRWLCTWHQ
jgi:hypothetical protein